jgi:hypothetical protein
MAIKTEDAFSEVERKPILTSDAFDESTPPQNPLGYLDRMRQGMNEQANKAVAKERAGDNPITANMAGATGAMAVPIGETIGLIPGVKQLGGAVSNFIQNDPETQKEIGDFKTAVRPAWNAIPQPVKDLGETALNAANIIGSATGLTGLAKNVATGGLGRAVSAVKDAIGITKPLEEVTKIGSERGIKPSVSVGNMDKFNENVDSSVKTIAQNRGQITLLDENGDNIVHPKTNEHFKKAIADTKKVIYKEYNGMAKTAGDEGVQFSSGNTIDRLDAVVNNPAELPEVRAYAEQMKPEILELEGASPEVVEERIKRYNQTLDDYYKGRHVDGTTASVRGSIAKSMRADLDQTIMSKMEEGGPTYQELKNKYGALSAIEGEVQKRALYQARKATKNVADLSDIFTVGETLSGLATGNLPQAARGVIGFGVKEYQKYLNNPDTYINKMFKQVYKEVPEAPTTAPGVERGTPTFDRKGINPDEVNADAIQARDLGNTVADVRQTIQDKAIPNAVRGLRPEITPEMEKVEAMRRFQRGEAPDETMANIGRKLGPDVSALSKMELPPSVTTTKDIRPFRGNETDYEKWAYEQSVHPPAPDENVDELIKRYRELDQRHGEATFAVSDWLKNNPGEETLPFFLQKQLLKGKKK